MSWGQAGLQFAGLVVSSSCICSWKSGREKWPDSEARDQGSFGNPSEVLIAVLVLPAGQQSVEGLGSEPLQGFPKGNVCFKEKFGRCRIWL